ncbi:class I SAM-dependent methyltransferase [Glycomyces sp. L485]|uniref:class I SAM-dependent methyltransferase n=1 Tax=Glycomyces sp. L485 TaxID=2909235 RepID=UPI001F4ACFD7|nr:class I SAM-dependent methyltransferase [Glycomyces sp. L485]MCH7229348.1 class I SAM-dependent methyltransferase [Glycomyces sp. L485]
MAHVSSHESSAVIDFGEEAERFREHADDKAEGERRAAARISRESDAVIVDVGCGAGGMALALAASHPGARVIAVDAEQALVDLARERAEDAGLAVETAVSNIDEPERLAKAVGAPADLVWAGHVLHHAADQQAALDTLAGLLATGGRLAIGEGGVASQFLPWNVGIGRPGLELRLAEAGSRRMEAENLEHRAEPMPYGWNLALERAGLAEVSVINDVTALPAPLEGEALKRALHVLSSRVGWFEDFIDAEDQVVWETLLDEDSPHWLGRRRDLHHLEIQSIYMGVSPGSSDG